MRIKYPRPILFIAMLLGLALSPRSAFSQAPFYQGKIVRIINNDPGGTAGTRVKTVVPYLRKYIPGNPTIIVEFVEGGGGRRSAIRSSTIKPYGSPSSLEQRAISCGSSGNRRYVRYRQIHLSRHSREREPQCHLHSTRARSQ